MAATLTLRSVKGSPLSNNEVDANFTNLNTEISSIETDVGTINSNISTLQTNLGTAESDITTLEGSISTLQTDLNTAEGNITTLQTELNTAEGNITTLQSSVSTLETSVGGSNLNETIADIVGGMVSGNTESGISVTYQDADNTLDFNVADFTITMTGDATGSGTVTNLGNVSIAVDVSTIVGNLTVSGDVNAANFNATSDARLKTNIAPIHNAMDIINNIQGVNFDWLESGKSSSGVLAQEVEKILPQAVNEDEYGVKRVSYNNIIPLLIEAIKELNSKIK